MESIPFSIFLEDFGLAPDEPINWLDESSGSEGRSNSITYLDSSPTPNFLLLKANEEKDGTSLAEENSESAKDGSVQKKRKRQQIKTDCEAKRRNRLNEKMEILRSLLSASEQNEKPSKLTREALMGSAIQEIVKLRQMNLMLAQAQQVMTKRYPQQSLVDPYNRDPYSVQDLERAFDVMFSRQVIQNCTLGNNKTTDEIVCQVKMLQDVSNQIGNPLHQISASVMEQTLYSTIKFNPKELSRCIEKNWLNYQLYQRDHPEGIFLYGADIGACILNDMIMEQYSTGNLEAFERTQAFIKQYLKTFSHAGTLRWVLANLSGTYWGSISLPLAKRLNQVLEGTLPFAAFGTLIVGAALIQSGRHKEGLDAIDKSVSEMMSLGQGQDSVHIFSAPTLMSAFIQTRSVERGLALANYVLKKFSENHIESYLGTAEILRQKANLLLMKKYPDFEPEPQTFKQADSFVEEILNLCEILPKSQLPSQPCGPLLLPAMLTPSNENSYTEDIESTLHIALELARSRGLNIVELRCTVDLTRYYLHIQNFHQALKSAKMIKDSLLKIRGFVHTGEINRANTVIAMAQQYSSSQSINLFQ